MLYVTSYLADVYNNYILLICTILLSCAICHDVGERSFRSYMNSAPRDGKRCFFHCLG